MEAASRKTARGSWGRWGLTPIVAAIALLCPPQARSEPAVPQGVWLMDGRVAVQIFDCAQLMCGRIIWLAVPRDLQGVLDRDKKNPNPALRERKLCGLTVLWGLHPVGPDRWRDGWFYNPDDGVTYRVKAQLKSADVLVARVYVGVPLLGKTKTLVRVTHDTTEGWC